MEIHNFEIFHKSAARLRFALLKREPVSAWTTLFTIQLPPVNKIPVPPFELAGEVFDVNGTFDVVLTKAIILALPIGTHRYSFRRLDVGEETILTSGTVSIRNDVP